MVDTARTGGITTSRHAAVLEAVAFAAERLLLAGDWREAADEVLERMGLAAGVSRAYVIENHAGDDGRLLGTMRHEWCAPGITSQLGDPFLDAAPWDEGFERWAALHGRGEPIVAHVAELPDHERSEFEAQGRQLDRRAPDLRRRRVVGRDRLRRLRTTSADGARSSTRCARQPR